MMCKEDCLNWKPKEIQCKNCVHSPRKGKICTKYVKGFSCFQQKTCGNCGRHDEHPSLYCRKIKRTVYSWVETNKHNYGDNCSWKPKECPTCGGTEMVCEVCGGQCIRNGKGVPCPDCQPKEEVLLMPIEWRGDNVVVYFAENKKFLQICTVSQNVTNNDWHAYINGQEDFLVGFKFKNKFEAKQAIEKALKITKK